MRIVEIHLCHQLATSEAVIALLHTAEAVSALNRINHCLVAIIWQGTKLIEEITL